MDIRILQYFLMVAREENITRAAEILGVTQPTLSRQMQQLEDELGVSLFHRGRHQVYLTEEGTIFRRRAQELVTLAEMAKDELKQEHEELAGRIAIGCVELQSVKEIAGLMAQFQQRFPNVKFDLYSSDNEDIKDRLDRGIIDIGLLLEPVNIAKYQFIRMQTKEQWGVLIHQDAPLAAQSVIRPGDLVGTLVVTVHLDTPVHHELVNWSGDFAQHMEPAVHYNSLYNAAVVARERKGAVVCLKLDSEYRDMKFLPLEPKLELSSVLAWKGHESYSKVTEAFLNYVKGSYQNTSELGSPCK